MKRVLRKLKSRIIKVRHDKRGVALIEFAIIAVPFFALVLGMLEVGLIFWGGYELDNATLTASRLIRTGNAPATQTAMVSAICSYTALLSSNCGTTLVLSVQTFPSFSCVANPTQSGCSPGTNYPPGPSQIVLVTASYEWPLFNFATVALLSNLPDGNHLIQSSAVFKTEPW